jgi:hypothetical protein
LAAPPAGPPLAPPGDAAAVAIPPAAALGVPPPAGPPPIGPPGPAAAADAPAVAAVPPPAVRAVPPAPVPVAVAPVLPAVVAPAVVAPVAVAPAAVAQMPPAAIPAAIAPSPLDRIRGQDRDAVLVMNPPGGYSWASYFSEEGCTNTNEEIEVRIREGILKMWTQESTEYVSMGTPRLRAINIAVANHVQTSRLQCRAKWGALVRYLRVRSQINGAVHTNNEIFHILRHVNRRTIRRMRIRAFPIP